MRRAEFLLAAALFMAWFVAGSAQPLQAAEFTYRPDLAAHISKLERIYPAEGPGSITGDAPSMIAPSSELHVGLEDGGGPGLTVIELSGVIQKGDAEKLDAALDGAKTWGKAIVFNSPGGNFLEGFRIAERIRYDLESQDPGINGVYVLAGEKCLSACSIAFALAVDLVHDVYDGRFIEEGGEIGFHMGFLPKEKAAQTAEIGQVLNLSYDIVGAYNQLLLDGANPPSLLREALKHRTADSFYLLDGDLEAWGMGFSPVSKGLSAQPALGYGLDTRAASRLCNTIMMNSRIYKSGVDLEFGHVGAGADLSVLEAAEGRDIYYSTGSHASIACTMMIDRSQRLHAVVWRGEPICAVGEQGGAEAWCIGAPVTTEPVTVGLFGDAYGCHASELAPEKLWISLESQQSIKRPGVVSREVNFRDKPDLSGAVINQLQPDQIVDIIGCRQTDDAQGVWYWIDAGGQIGWVSARFVEPRLLQVDPSGRDY